MHGPDPARGKQDASALAPLLTIAIPTFNRLSCLRLLVDSLGRAVAGINRHAVRVGVLVCDNASADGTAAYLDQLAWRGLRVIHHARNIGADANVIHCFEQVTGRYAWICGDDDLPLGGAVADVVDLLERERPDLLYLPAQWHAGELTAYAGQAAPAAAVLRRDAFALAVEANAYITFISSWVVNCETYQALANPPEPRRHAGTSLPQLEWHLALLARAPKLMAVSRPWLLARAGHSGGYSLFDVFVNNYTRIVDDKLDAQPDLRRFFREFMLRGYLPGLIWGWRQGVAGTFEGIDRHRLVLAIRQTWQDDSVFARLLQCLIQWPRPFAKAAFVITWVCCKIWISLLKRRAKGAIA
jgi:abequosyltransferase